MFIELSKMPMLCSLQSCKHSAIKKSLLQIPFHKIGYWKMNIVSLSTTSNIYLFIKSTPLCLQSIPGFLVKSRSSIVACLSLIDSLCRAVQARDRESSVVYILSSENVHFVKCTVSTLLVNEPHCLKSLDKKNISEETDPHIFFTLI